MDNTVRLSGIAYESLVNGPGMRRVIFSQGCTHNCKGCFNPDTHDFNGGELRDMNEIIEDIRNTPFLKGVTFSGGDPLDQAREFAYLGKEIKKLGLNIWCYTGYKFEDILKNKEKLDGLEELLRYIDVLVDGKFEEKNKVEGLRYRGSSNQRIIDIKDSLELGEVQVLNYD